MEVSTAPLSITATEAPLVSTAVAPSSVYVSPMFKFIVAGPFNVITGNVELAVVLLPLFTVVEEDVEEELFVAEPEEAALVPDIASIESSCGLVIHV